MCQLQVARSVTLTVYTEERSTVAGHVLIVYKCSLLCTHHTDMTVHTAALTSRGALRPLACS